MFMYKFKFKTVVCIYVINKINCYHSLLNEVMVKNSLIYLGNLLIEKKNMHLPCNKIEYVPWNGP